MEIRRDDLLTIEKPRIVAVTFREGGSWIEWSEWKQFPSCPPPNDKRVHAIKFVSKFDGSTFVWDAVSGWRPGGINW